MTLCNNLSQKRGVGVFLRVGVFSRDYSTTPGTTLFSIITISEIRAHRSVQEMGVYVHVAISHCHSNG